MMDLSKTNFIRLKNNAKCEIGTKLQAIYTQQIAGNIYPALLTIE